MPALADDLAAETAALQQRLAGLHKSLWRRDTPSRGWCVIDQVSHLAHVDGLAMLSATQPEEFRRQKAARQGPIDLDAVVASHRRRMGAKVSAWFSAERADVIAFFRDLDPTLRLPWFGPDMSAASLLTARLMETWAHGYDVADALAVTPEPTNRLRHVAHLGVGAKRFSYTVNGLTMPPDPVRVELTSPDGENWTWGLADARQSVAGPALDFCLVVTRRRHVQDTVLQVQGADAEQWMAIAQAYAGPPGTGRLPGSHQRVRAATSSRSLLGDPN